MANTKSAKSNPASKRAKNKLKNERLKEKGQHPKQLRQKENEARQALNAMMINDYGFQNRKQIHAFAKESRVSFLETGPSR